MGYKLITKEEIGRMCELWISGIPIRQIAYMMGYTEATVDRHLSDAYLGTTHGETVIITKQSALNDIDFKPPDPPGVNIKIYPPRLKAKGIIDAYKVSNRGGERKSDY